MYRSSNFEKNLDSATSHLRLDPDWPTIMKICDAIRQNDVTPKNAVALIKKKMQAPNPHTAEYALWVLESIVKNCGSPIHDEIATTSNCEFFATLVNTTKHDNVRTKMLELIQAWASAFRSSHKYQAVKDTMNILKAEGHKFPELKEADAMFASDTAPDWADGLVCNRCRVVFSLTVRRHHCRNCGQIFCGKCSAKTSSIPRFGIEKDVRVCDACYTHLQKPSSRTPRPTEGDLPAEYLTSSLAQQSQVGGNTTIGNNVNNEPPQLQQGPPRKTEQELQEEEELQLAIALSQSEAEQKSKVNVAYVPRAYPKSPSPEPANKRSPSPVEDPPSDPELARYLNRNYWEQRKTTESPASPSAPSPMPLNPQGIKIIPEDAEIDDFSNVMKTQLEIFVNRMKSNSSRGRSISTDSSVQTLFMTFTSLHSRLLNYTKDMDDKRLWYEQLQDKLNQVRDSRAALDVLRQEHQDKLRRQAEEQERLRQFQMAQKLEIMRKKKQEYLQYQRQIALQRIQEQEREMQMRQEQQKVQYRIGAQNFPYMQAPPQHGSPVHHQIPGGYGAFSYNQMPGVIPMPRFGPGAPQPSGMQLYSPPFTGAPVSQQPMQGMSPQHGIEFNQQGQQQAQIPGMGSQFASISQNTNSNQASVGMINQGMSINQSQQNNQLMQQRNQIGHSNNSLMQPGTMAMQPRMPMPQHGTSIQQQIPASPMPQMSAPPSMQQQPVAPMQQPVVQMQQPVAQMQQPVGPMQQQPQAIQQPISSMQQHVAPPMQQPQSLQQPSQQQQPVATMKQSEPPKTVSVQPPVIQQSVEPANNDVATAELISFD